LDTQQKRVASLTTGPQRRSRSNCAALRLRSRGYQPLPYSMVTRVGRPEGNGGAKN
jgi:hypothetical protein